MPVPGRYGLPAGRLWVVAGTWFYALLLTLGVEAQSGEKSVAAGLKVGAVIGFLLWGTADFILFGYQNVNNLTAAIANTVLEGIRGGIGGAIIAFTLGKIGD